MMACTFITLLLLVVYVQSRANPQNQLAAEGGPIQTAKANTPKNIYLIGDGPMGHGPMGHGRGFGNAGPPRMGFGGPPPIFMPLGLHGLHGIDGNPNGTNNTDPIAYSFGAVIFIRLYRKIKGIPAWLRWRFR